ncbi:TraR/DksA C4-type zinc finger protein [Streptomyces exfoliatus]|uniref:TraR/DksA C4-type zinc finger protein n=1 Tax=Streptomyces exfoliatus TaxID=1905 RepID=UPI003C2B3AEF
MLTLHGIEPYKEAADEEYMGESMRKHFTALLSTWRGDLVASGDQEAAKNGAGLEEELALELGTREGVRKVLQAINKSLRCLQDEEYGWCEDCGAEIGLRTLEARPTESLCTVCKEHAKKEKQISGV